MSDANTVEPVVSIVIVGHSVRDELERCLASIAEHAAVPVQTILVDNASTDGTAASVREAHPDVEIVELPENIGVAARQEGLVRARGRYIMFLDSDARLTEGALPALVGALDEHPGWGLLGPRLVYADGSHQQSARRLPPLATPLIRRPPLSRFFEDGKLVRRHLMMDSDPDAVRPVMYVIGACQIFRSELARAAGSFDTIFFGPDDIDWCIRIRDAGGEVVYHPQATVVHDYRRMTQKSPFSRTALRHLTGFAAFQWKYRKRRGELRRLERELDRRAAA